MTRTRVLILLSSLALLGMTAVCLAVRRRAAAKALLAAAVVAGVLLPVVN